MNPKAIIIAILAIIVIAVMFLISSKSLNINDGADSGDGISLTLGGQYEGKPDGPLHPEGTVIPPKPTDKQLAEIYDKALENDQKLKKDYRDYEAYLTGGLAWKSLGDLTNDLVYYDLSADVYAQGLIGYGDDFYVLWLNLGNVKRLAGKFGEAEKAYLEGIRIFPKEPQLYIALAELYRYDYKKESQLVIKTYEDALKTIDINEDRGRIIGSYAAYLRDVKDYAGAVKYYTELIKIYPNEALYKKELEDLKAKLGA